MRLIEPVINLVRQWDVRGKGRLFSPFVARSGTRTVAVWGPHRMTLDLGDVVQRQMFMGCFGHYIAHCLRRLLGPGDAFLDVGAHMGYFTLLAATRVAATGRVYAVEPTPATFAGLQRHLAENGIGTVRTEQAALGAAPGHLRLYLPPAGENRPHNVTSLPQPGWAAIDVPCHRLDDRAAEWNLSRVKVMKVDVEGAEPFVLAGGQDTLSRGVVGHVVCEFNGVRLTEAGSSPADLLRRFEGLGFLPAKLIGRRAVPVPASTWDLDPAHEHDRLLVHRTWVE